MSDEEIRTIAAVVAVAVSLLSLVITRLQTRKAERFGRRPVLVIRTNKLKTKWSVENIGKGPALDVALFQRDSTHEWHGMLLPDVAADAETTVSSQWVDEDCSEMVIRYRSVAESERYVTRVHDDRAEPADGWKKIPKVKELVSHRDFL